MFQNVAVFDDPMYFYVFVPKTTYSFVIHLYEGKMSSERTKIRHKRAAYKTRVPRQRGGVSDKDFRITRDSYDFICAIVNADKASRRERPVYDAFLLEKTSDNTQVKYLFDAKKIILEWESSGVPRESLIYFARNYPKVWPIIPVVRNAMIADAEAYEVSTDLTDLAGRDDLNAAEKLLAHLPADVLNPNSANWEDLTDFQEASVHRRFEELCQDTLDFLLSTKRKRVKLSFKRILQHWSVDCNIAHDKMTKLLKLLKKHQPRVRKRDYDSLPYTGRTLVKLDIDEVKKIAPIAHIRSEKSRAKDGTYLSYGVIGGILGTSPG